MIILTRLSGATFAVNPDLIERADCTPDTVITLVDGTKYVVTEPVHLLIERIMDFRARVIARSAVFERDSTDELATLDAVQSGPHVADVLPLHRRGV